MHLLESYNLCDINKACMALRDDGTINKPVYTQPIVEKAQPIIEKAEKEELTAKEKFLLERTVDIFSGGDNPTFTSIFGMHDPVLLNPEAYEYLWGLNRYAQPEVAQ